MRKKEGGKIDQISLTKEMSENSSIYNQKMEYKLSKWMVNFLFILYSVFTIAGIVVLVFILSIYDFERNLMLCTIISSFAAGLTTCSMQYIRKLYKACISNRIYSGNKVNQYETIGNFFYFMLRPVFACVFIILTIFALKAGMIVIMSSGDFVENDRFLYVSTIIASCIGFSVGKVLDAFEEFSIRKINRILEANKYGGTTDDRRT